MASQGVLRSIKLVNYKGFENHTVSLRRCNVLVGANNAGKTTVLGALRLVAAMLPQARRTNPTAAGFLEGRPYRGWPITAAAIEASAFSTENIRHDFRPSETRIEVTTTRGVRLIASWESEEGADEDDPPRRGMYLVFPPSGSFESPRDVARNLTPRIAVVPTLTPLDDREQFITDETLRRNRTSKRSSRYFRNALWRLDEGEWRDFTSYVYERTPELTGLELHRAQDTLEDDFDLFFTEEQTRHEREISWAGDGIQIWLQVLFHVWTQRDDPVVVLDEPDVFLHPDLQRRLARTLFNTDQQVILATHSVEILAEAEPGSAVWVDRGRRSSERPSPDGSLGIVGRRLGSGYELGIGRALRSNAVVFVEGDDAPVLGHVARRLGYSSVAKSEAYATVPLGGFSRRWLAGAFSEAMAALGGSVRTFVILDSDLKSAAALDAETAPLRAAGASVHVWSRRELENYVLQVGAISRVSGASRDIASDLLTEVLDELKDEAWLAFQSQRIDESKQNIGGTGRLATKTVIEGARREFDHLWVSEAGRLAVVDAKLAIRRLNARLQASEHRTVNVHSLAKNLVALEAPEELRVVMYDLEMLITTSAPDS